MVASIERCFEIFKEFQNTFELREAPFSGRNAGVKGEQISSFRRIREMRLFSFYLVIQ
jgi:hypothetical protein